MKNKILIFLLLIISSSSLTIDFKRHLKSGAVATFVTGFAGVSYKFLVKKILENRGIEISNIKLINILVTFFIINYCTSDGIQECLEPKSKLLAILRVFSPFCIGNSFLISYLMNFFSKKNEDPLILPALVIQSASVLFNFILALDCNFFYEQHSAVSERDLEKEQRFFLIQALKIIFFYITLIGRHHLFGGVSGFGIQASVGYSIWNIFGVIKNLQKYYKMRSERNEFETSENGSRLHQMFFKEKAALHLFETVPSVLLGIFSVRALKNFLNNLKNQ